MCNIITMAVSFSVYAQPGSGQGSNDKMKVEVITMNKDPYAETMLISEKKSEKSKEDKKSNNARAASSEKTSMGAQAEYITKVDGKIFVKKNGKFLHVQNERMVEDMKVMCDGKIIMEDGSQEYLLEGEAMTMEGSIMKADEVRVLKERVREIDETCTALNKSNWEMLDVIQMLRVKTKLMDEKMDLVNHKLILMVDHMSKNHKTRKEIEEYEENISLLDAAIQNADIDIREIENLMHQASAKK